MGEEKVKHHTKMSAKESFELGKILEEACIPVTTGNEPTFRYADGWNSERVAAEASKRIGRPISSGAIFGLRKRLFGKTFSESKEAARSRWTSVDPATIESMGGRIQALYNHLMRSNNRVKALDDRVRFLESALGVSSPEVGNGASETDTIQT